MAKDLRQIESVSETLKSTIQTRIDDGLTVYRIAKDAGVDPGVVSRFLSSERQEIRSSTIDKLAESLGLELRPKKKA